MKVAMTIAVGLLVVSALAVPALAETSMLTESEVLELYQTIHARLADDSIEGVAEAAAAIAEKVQPCECESEEKTAYQELGSAARAMEGADLAALREQFKDLSRAMASWVEAIGAETEQLYFCPMAEGYWMQSRKDEATRNPYYGKSMLKCGNRVDEITE